MSIKQVAIALIRQDGNTQPRTSRHVDWCEDYAHDMLDGRWDWSRSGAPLTVFFDGADYWLADGFHRRDAAEVAGLEKVPCDVHKGTQRDAQLFSCGVNAVHGHRRTNDDKRRAVMFLLDDDEWSQWSDKEIARRCAVDNSFVSKLRRGLVSLDSPKIATDDKGTANGEIEAAPHRKVTRDGKTYAMATSKIGKRPYVPRDDTNDFIHHAVDGIVERFVGLSVDAEEAAARYPIDLAYSLRVQQIRAIGEWLIAFADTFATTREAARLRYIENIQQEVRRRYPMGGTGS